MYTYRVEQAIRAAAVLHKNQVRKGVVPLPFVTHLYAVTMIVSEYTSDEHTIVAALLHDTVEDTDYTFAELEEDFGKEVLEIVKALSEPQSDSKREITWKQQKQQYAKQLKKAPTAALLISAADKIHNMRCIVEDYSNDHVLFKTNFKGNLDDRLMMYQDISNVLNSRLKSGILTEFNNVYNEYKNLILDVKKTTENSKKT